MPQATFRFYAELNDFLAPARRGQSFEHAFWGSPTLQDILEGLGAPHTEVAMIVVDGEEAPGARRLRGGERVSVFPEWRSFGLGGMKPGPDSIQSRFALDTHLGRLARLLRLLGFDSLYANDLDDRTLASLSAEQGRIVLSRDRGLLKRRIVQRGYWVRSQIPRQQVVEVLRRFALTEACRPFTRCLACNGELRPAEAAEIVGRVPQAVLLEGWAFSMCRNCGRAYWPGSHYERLKSLASALLIESRLGGTPEIAPIERPEECDGPRAHDGST